MCTDRDPRKRDPLLFPSSICFLYLLLPLYTFISFFPRDMLAVETRIQLHLSTSAAAG